MENKPKKPKGKRRYLVPLDEIRKIMEDERVRRRLSQREIAKRMGVSESWVSNMESGHRDIRWDVWVKWCEAIRIHPSTIMDKWQNSNDGEKIGEKRKKEYYHILDEMIKLNFNPELDVLMVYYRGLVEIEKAERRKERSQRQYRKIYKEFKEIRKGDDQ